MSKQNESQGELKAALSVHQPRVNISTSGYRPLNEGYTPAVETRGYTPITNEGGLPVPPQGGTGASGSNSGAAGGASNSSGKSENR